MAESPNTRRSRRINCGEPQATLEDPTTSLSTEVRKLTSKGGVGGRIVDAGTRWNYFPQQSNNLEDEENNLQKKSILKGLDDNDYCRKNPQGPTLRW